MLPDGPLDCRLGRIAPNSGPPPCPGGQVGVDRRFLRTLNPLLMLPATRGPRWDPVMLRRSLTSS
jgi:hypothetical protein